MFSSVTNVVNKEKTIQNNILCKQLTTLILQAKKLLSA